MLASISPVGEAGRRQRWWVTAAAYLVGLVVGGVALGAFAGALGVLLATASWGAWRWGLLAIAALLAAAADTGHVPLRTDGWRRQVDERWLTTYRGWVYGLGFGLQLGFGLVTIVTSASIYLLVVVAILTGDLMQAVLLGALFGAVRALPVLLTWPVRGPRRLRSVHRLLAVNARRATGVTVAAQVAILVVAAVHTVGIS